jgi:glycerol uptake facilitator-like aquaporin
MTLGRRLTAESVGTALLLATVVGSGIMGERLAGGSVGLALLANTIATGAVLVALILAFGPISGAHFNPAVTLADASQGGLAWREAGAYVVVQVVGAVVGVAVVIARRLRPIERIMVAEFMAAEAEQLLQSERHMN